MDPLMSAPSLAKLAYEAYGNVIGHTNRVLWDDLPPRVQLAWDAAAVTAAQAGAGQ